MKSVSLFLVFIIAAVVNVFPDQPARGTWNLGLGPLYPRYDRVNIQIKDKNYGGFLELRRNFPDHIGLRAKAGFSHLTGAMQTVPAVSEKTDLLVLDLDILYYALPCEPISPYLYAGAGSAYRKSTSLMPSVDSTALFLQANVGGGVEWKLGSKVGLLTEFGYHFTPNSQLDAVVDPSQINKEDTYWDFALGLNIHFGSGPSCCCPRPIPAPTVSVPVRAGMDSAEVEALLKRYVPKEVIKQIVVEKNVPVHEPSDNLVIVGVSFILNKAELLPESYPVLDDIARIFAEHQQIKVEIQGYADSSGSDKYNDTLSLKRAQAVKTYLVERGIAEERLRAVGFGRRNPIVSDATEEGKRINRRVEFRIIK